MKIISGGQTGVDRAALDVAMKHGIECGGWCPSGRLDEFGRIPEHYPLEEDGSFAERTLRNVNDSDGTAIFYFENLRGGSAQTAQFCIEEGKPHQLIEAAKTSVKEAARLIVDLAREHKISVLNVAGPRQSEWPEGYEYASRVLDLFLTRSATPSPDRAGRRNKPE